jgi:hypothetical protein
VCVLGAALDVHGQWDRLKVVPADTSAVPASVPTWAERVPVVAEMVDGHPIRDRPDLEQVADAVRVVPLPAGAGDSQLPVPVHLGAAPDPAFAQLSYASPETFYEIFRETLNFLRHMPMI